MARNRNDLTKSKRVCDVTRLIDVQPDHSKDWDFVKEVLFASFGQDNDSPEYKLGTLIKSKPDDFTTAGLATFISDIRARLQEWVKTTTPPEMTEQVNKDRATITRINKFLAVTFLSTFVPEETRRNAVDILKDTNWENLARKTAELINAAAPASTFAAKTSQPPPDQQR